MSSASRRISFGGGGTSEEDEDDEEIYVPPEVGDRVYSKFTNGKWYWGVVKRRFWKRGEWCFSILYDDGDFIKELRTQDGVATVAQNKSDPKFVTGRASPSSSISSYGGEDVDRGTLMVENNKHYPNVTDASDSVAYGKKRKASSLFTTQVANKKGKGFYFNRFHGKWYVQFAFAQRQRFFGLFKTCEEAELAAQIAREELRRWEGIVRRDTEIKDAIQAAKQAIADGLNKESTDNNDGKTSPVIAAKQAVKDELNFCEDENTLSAAIPKQVPKKLPGVHFHSQSRKWMVYPYFAGSKRYFGLFDTIERANLVAEIALRTLQQWEGNVLSDNQIKAAVDAAMQAVSDELNGLNDETVKKVGNGVYEIRRGNYVKWNVILEIAGEDHDFGLFASKKKAIHVSALALQKFELVKSIASGGETLRVIARAAAQALINEIRNESEEVKKAHSHTNKASKSPSLPRPQSLEDATKDPVASEKEYCVQGDPAVLATTLSRKLAYASDHSLVSDYLFFVMKQLRRCEFTESDKKNHKKQKNGIGFGGLECIHCAEMPNVRKFFPASIDSMNGVYKEASKHLLMCRYCPRSVKNSLFDLKQSHLNQTAALPKGSQRNFLCRMWDRIHTDGDPETTLFGATCTVEENRLPGYSHNSTTLPPPHGRMATAATARVAREDHEMPMGNAAIPAAAAVAATASLPSVVTPPSVGHVEDPSSVLSFLEHHKDCLKCSPARFHQWLLAEDVNMLTDLFEACNDADYVNGDMQENGLKGFKRNSFVTAVKNAVANFSLQN